MSTPRFGVSEAVRNRMYPGGTVDSTLSHKGLASKALGGGPPRGALSGGRGGGGGGGRGSGRFRMPTGNAPSVTPPPRPNLPPIDPQAPFDPNLEAYRDRYGQHLTNLEEGTGYAMDVLRQGQQDSLEAEVMRMRAAAEQAGIPFDEGEARAELQRGINSSMAEEKLGREAMLTGAYDVGRGIYEMPASERFNRLELDLRRDVADSEANLDLYGRDIQRYGIDVGAATQANNALLSFYNSLLSGITSMANPSYSSSTYYG